MNNHTVSLLINFTIASSCSFSVSAAQHYFQARNDAMGGTGVASSHYLSAPLSNPALLSRFSPNDDIALLLPVIGGQITDNDHMHDGIDAAIDLINELALYTSDSPAARATANDLANTLTSLDNDQLSIQLGLAAILAVPNNTISFALFTNSYLDLNVESDIDDADITALKNQDPTMINTLNSQLSLQGVGVTDIGISLASKFILGTTPIYLGISPKIQTIGFYEYTSNIHDFDITDFNQDNYSYDNVAFNIDAGFVIEPNPYFTFGLVAKNLVKRLISNTVTNLTYKIKPQLTTGFSLHNTWFSTAVDLDITQSQNLNSKGPSRYTRIGAEIDALGWLQFRAGFRYDVEQNSSNQVTFGIGLAPFEVVHFDLTGMHSADNNYGFVAQTSFTF